MNFFKILKFLLIIGIIIGAFWLFFSWGLLIWIRDAYDHGDYGMLICAGIFALGIALVFKLTKKKH